MSVENLQSCAKIIEIAAKNNLIIFKYHMVRLKIISLYIYKDLRLRSNESRDHYHEDGNLVPSPRCGFSFEAAFQL